MPSSWGPWPVNVQSCTISWLDTTLGPVDIKEISTGPKSRSALERELQDAGDTDLGVRRA